MAHAPAIHPRKECDFVGILDEITDDYGRKQYALQLEGSKTGRELPGIVDEVITMAILSGDHGQKGAFICQPLNEWGYPAKIALVASKLWKNHTLAN